MEDGIDPVGEDLAQAAGIGDVTDDQPGAIGHGRGMAAREVVVDDDLVAGLDEALDACRADVPGAPDDEDPQYTLLVT